MFSSIDLNVFGNERGGDGDDDYYYSEDVRREAYSPDYDDMQTLDAMLRYLYEAAILLLCILCLAVALGYAPDGHKDAHLEHVASLTAPPCLAPHLHRPSELSNSLGIDGVRWRGHTGERFERQLGSRMHRVFYDNARLPSGYDALQKFERFYDDWCPMRRDLAVVVDDESGGGVELQRPRDDGLVEWWLALNGDGDVTIRDGGARRVAYVSHKSKGRATVLLYDDAHRLLIEAVESDLVFEHSDDDDDDDNENAIVRTWTARSAQSRRVVGHLRERVVRDTYLLATPQYSVQLHGAEPGTGGPLLRSIARRVESGLFGLYARAKKTDNATPKLVASIKRMASSRLPQSVIDARESTSAQPWQLLNAPPKDALGGDHQHMMLLIFARLVRHAESELSTHHHH
jgi:hypothetical protein